MDKFLTYEMMLTYVIYISVLYMVVNFIKEKEPFKDMKTKFVAFYVGCLLMTLIYTYTYFTQIYKPLEFSFSVVVSFLLYLIINIPLIILNAIIATYTTNGVSDFNNKVDKTRKDD